jgi:thioredoxin 1
MPTKIVESKKEYDDLLNSHPYAVVYATASWCGPCKAIGPFFDKHASEYDIPEKIAFIKFDTDEVPDIAQELGIRSIPAFFTFEDGGKIDSLSGANPPALLRLIAEVHQKAGA